MSSEPTSVSASLFYFESPADGSKPFQYTCQFIEENPVEGVRGQNFQRVEKLVHIENLRGREDSKSLDKNGFQFLRQPTKHTSFANDQEIRGEYYLESIELIKQVTGASRVVIFDHTVRRHYAVETEDTPNTRQPVSSVHVDQTPASASARVHRHLSAQDVSKLLAKRFQILNLWRPIHHAAYDYPLALCDHSTTDPHTDLVAITLKPNGETFGVQYNPTHGWKYVRGLMPEECVLFKCFDSVQDGSVAVFTPHSAFVDPTIPPDAPKRESIELRALVFYD
ncbi:hypothetical protein PENSPDRAFT_293360 [Peniophora sp. CONT]|nr:hypothetical protein PENSPDRAFT_293360 [Peniophora sp. CONT]